MSSDCSDVCDSVYEKICTNCPHKKTCHDENNRIFIEKYARNHEQMVQCIIKFLSVTDYPKESEIKYWDISDYEYIDYEKKSVSRHD